MSCELIACLPNQKALKIVLGLSFLFCFVHLGFAQRFEEKNTEIRVGYGVALPVSGFASTDYKDSLSGFALNGTNFNASVSYLVAKNIGVMARLSSSSNKLNTGEFQREYDPVLDTLEGTISDFRAGKWYSLTYMAGAYFQFPIKQIVIDAHLLAGLAKTELPEIGVTIYSLHYTDAVKLIREKNTSSAFSFDIGAGINYIVSELMLVGMHADFFSARQKFKNVLTVSSIADDQLQDLTKPLSLFNFTFGIGFRF